jgi:hypothetical protein
MTETVDRPTVEQVRNEHAGRRMDELVAEFVMRWEHWDDFNEDYDGTYPVWWLTSKIIDIGCEVWIQRIKSDDYVVQEIWSPSTDITQAMEALESQKSIQLWQLTKGQLLYYFDTELVTNGVPADTIPLAICRYLLIAVLEGTL